MLTSRSLSAPQVPQVPPSCGAPGRPNPFCASRRWGMILGALRHRRPIWDGQRDDEGCWPVICLCEHRSLACGCMARFTSLVAHSKVSRSEPMCGAKRWAQGVRFVNMAHCMPLGHALAFSICNALRARAFMQMKDLSIAIIRADKGGITKNIGRLKSGRRGIGPTDRPYCGPPKSFGWRV